MEKTEWVIKIRQQRTHSHPPPYGCMVPLYPTNVWSRALDFFIASIFRYKNGNRLSFHISYNSTPLKYPCREPHGDQFALCAPFFT